MRVVRDVNGRWALMGFETKVKLVSKGWPTYLSTPVQKLYPLEIKSQKGGGWVGTAPGNGKCAENSKSKRSTPPRMAARKAECKNRLMFDS